MRNLKLLLIGAMTSVAALSLSQRLPSAAPPEVPAPYVLRSSRTDGEVTVFRLQGKRYRAKISREEVYAGPDWRPSMPLPLNFAEAEEIARAELHKLLVDDSGWQVMDLRLRRIHGNDHPKWFYAVGLAPTMND